MIMASVKNTFQLLTALPIALVVVGAYYAWNQHYISHSDGTILVITITDPATKGASQFSKQVYDGAFAAKNALDHAAKLDEIRLDVDAKTKLPLLISQRISQYRILGIISAGTSQTDKALAVLCRHLHIPLLIAVATNDSLLSHETEVANSQIISSAPLRASGANFDQIEREQDEDDLVNAGHSSTTLHGVDVPAAQSALHDGQTALEERVVFRMLPNNTQQAIAIAKKIEKLGKPSGSNRILIFHEENEYASFLYETLRPLVSNQLVFDYTVEDSGSISSSLPSLQRLASESKISGIIYLGYSDHSLELLQGLDAWDVKVPIILSDGCYSKHLFGTASQLSSPVYLAFPIPPNLSSDGSLSGFGVYGANAYNLLAHLNGMDAASEGRPLLDVLNSEIRKREGKFGPIGMDQLPAFFSHTGEPQLAMGIPTAFQICQATQPDWICPEDKHVANKVPR
jgi:hypothetical protein